MKFLDLSTDRQVKQYLSITQTEGKILEWKGNGIKRDNGTALCRPFSEKYFASLTFGNIG